MDENSKRLLTLKKMSEHEHFLFKDLPTNELEELSLIIGKNSSGKSTLLKAISTGEYALEEKGRILNCAYVDGTRVDITTSINRNPTFLTPEIHSYLWEALAPLHQKIIETSPNLLEIPYKELRKEFEGQKPPPYDLVEMNVVKQRISSVINGRQKELSHSSRLSEFSFKRFEFLINNLRWSLAKIFDKYSLIYHISDSNFHMSVYSIIKDYQNAFSIYSRYHKDKFNKSAIETDYEEISNFKIPKTITKEEYYKPLEQPIDIINNIIKKFELPFIFGKNLLAPVKPENFLSNDIDDEFPVGNLSSGEKVLAWICFSLFKGLPGLATTKNPDIILLDEIDASLHPSIIKEVFQYIENTFIEEMGIGVIATSHSPTTVAILENATVYELANKNLNVISRKSAVNKLLDGLPKIFLDADGVKNIFVEDQSDKKILSLAYQNIAPYRNHDFSPNFISISQRLETKETRGGGKDILKTVVESLKVNPNICGLIDYDSKNRTNNNVFVLAEGKRDALENILYDPLLVLAFLVRMGAQHHAPRFGFADLQEATTDQVQNAVREVTDIICEWKYLREVKYVGGKYCLQIPEEYLLYDDKKLSEKINKRYNIGNLLNVDRQISYKYMEFAASILFRDSNLIPLDLVLTLDEILGVKM